MIDGLWLLLRATGFVLVLQAAGTALFLAALAPIPVRSAAVIRRTMSRVAAIALGVLIAQYIVEAAHLAGEWAGVADPSLLRLVTSSSTGAAFLVRIGALAALVIGLARDGRVLRALTLAASVAALGSFLLTGHTAVHTGRGLLAPLLFVHLGLVAFWFGSLWPLRQVASLEAPADAARLIKAFSSLALWLVPLIPLAGAGIATVLLPGLAALWEPYGRLLDLKVLLFAALMGVAALNKRRLAPALARGEEGAAVRLRRSLAIEYTLICATLAVTAAMTGFFSPTGTGGATVISQLITVRA